MTYDAVPRLFVKLFTSDAIPELCLAFTILTAVRSQEARGARWDEFDFKAGVWTVPPSRMKRRREHRIPLSAEAVKLIQRLPRTGEYLFTANGNGSPIVAMSLRKALHRHGGDAFTVHGFRSAFRTWGGERSNAPRELLEVALSHAIGNQTEAAYARGDLLEKRRRIMQQWAAHCVTPAAPTPGKVVAIGGAVAMADAAKPTIDDLIAWGLDYEELPRSLVHQAPVSPCCARCWISTSPPPTRRWCSSARRPARKQRNHDHVAAGRLVAWASKSCGYRKTACARKTLIASWRGRLASRPRPCCAPTTERGTRQKPPQKKPPLRPAKNPRAKRLYLQKTSA